MKFGSILVTSKETPPLENLPSYITFPRQIFKDPLYHRINGVYRADSRDLEVKNLRIRFLTRNLFNSLCEWDRSPIEALDVCIREKN